MCMSGREDAGDEVGSESWRTPFQDAASPLPSPPPAFSCCPGQC